MALPEDPPSVTPVLVTPYWVAGFQESDDQLDVGEPQLNELAFLVPNEMRW